jgi:cytochrome c2
MRKLVSGILVAGVCIAVLPQMATARPDYNGSFLKKYEIKPESNIGKAKCGVCHGAQKTERNVYGQALEKALGKPKASGDEATEALKKIENMPSADKKTKFLELIKADKLPGAPAAAK